MPEVSCCVMLRADPETAWLALSMTQMTHGPIALHDSTKQYFLQVQHYALETIEGSNKHARSAVAK